jgi:hypothetical protein
MTDSPEARLDARVVEGFEDMRARLAPGGEVI